MGTPTKIDTLEDVNNFISTAKRDDKGKVIIENVDPVAKIAIQAELRRRDTESSFTKTRQELKAKELAIEELSKNLNIEVEYNEADLEALKYSDPDKWRAKLNEIEQLRVQKTSETISSITEKAQIQAINLSAEEKLETALKNIPSKGLTTKELLDRVPPILVRNLNEGKITMEEFSSDANSIINGKAVVNQEHSEPEPSFSATPGSNESVINNNNSSYEEITF